jgi:hypothetical protein
MLILKSGLSLRQEDIIKDIAKTHLRSLLEISSDGELLIGLTMEEKEKLIKALLRDFSTLVTLPHQLFNSHAYTKALFKHELFHMSSEDSVGLLYVDHDEVRGLWKKINIDSDFAFNQLN